MHINDQEPHRRWSAYTCRQFQTRIMPFDCLVHVARYLGLTRALLRWRWTMLTMIVIYTVNLIHPLIQEEMLASIDSDLKEQGLPTESVILNQNKKLTTRTHEAPNLLSPHVMESGSLSLRGWWMSHVKWKMTEMKWTSTSRAKKVFSVACAVHRIVETYQHLSLNRSIPIKGIKFYVSSASWKMARPTVSLQRNYKAFYGARVFVVLSSGKRKLLKLDFPPDSGKVMSKRAKFISPEGEQITSVTVMLGCFGYEGYVTFTDLAVKPIYDFELMRNQSIEPAQLLEPCQAPSRRPHEKSGDFLTEILYSASSPADYDAVTLVTQLTFNRINMLKTNLRFWNGPLSIAVYVLLEDVNNIELKKMEVKKRLSTDIFRKYSTVSVVVIYGNKTGHQYPINRLRNIAIKNVKTKYIFMIDVDFVPSPDLERLARDEILHYNETRNTTDDKIAFVVPAFDGARHANIRDLPETKEELVKMVKRKNKLAPFRQIESPLSHSSTNYTKWYHANQSYEVSGYQDKYEPYLILRLTPELPLYDEGFTGYGMNKISHVIELALLGYKFIVLPNVWIVHRYHVLSPLSLAHMTDPVSRFANRLQRFEFITDLYIKHKLGHCNNAKRQS